MVTGDFDGDGIDDLAVGVAESDLARPQGGAVFIYKGSAAGLPERPTWTLVGDSDTARFGTVLAAGDLTGDGRADLMITSPGADLTISDSGALYLYTWGPKGPTPIRPPLTCAGRGNFGAALAVGDVDNDGDPDLIVTSPQGDVGGGSRRGVVDVFLIKKGAAIPDLGAIRLSGMDLKADGTVTSTANLGVGRAVAAGDLNGDGLTDLAVMGQVNNSLLNGTHVARLQVAIQVYLSRGGARPYGDTPDAYVLPANLADSNEGRWKLDVVPAMEGRPPFLLVIADATDSPDLSAQGGNRAATNAGGALLFDLTALKPQPTPPAAPPQLGREDAFARIYGDAAGVSAGRAYAFLDVDGVPGLELILAAPQATVTFPGKTYNLAGRLLAYPLTALARGQQVNRPVESLPALEAVQVLGAALAPWRLPGHTALATVAGRATTPLGNFTGQVELLSPTPNGFGSWKRTATPLPASPAVEAFGASVAAARIGSRRVAVVGSP
ncbi:MAG: FG-GAP repeat domain-containing protein, partial [Myxococcales bacterium]